MYQPIGDYDEGRHLVIEIRTNVSIKGTLVILIV